MFIYLHYSGIAPWFKRPPPHLFSRRCDVERDVVAPVAIGSARTCLAMFRSRHISGMDSRRRTCRTTGRLGIVFAPRQY